MPILNLSLTHLIDDAKCYEIVRQMRWRTGVCCLKCNSPTVIKQGKEDTQTHRQRYQCKGCKAHFDEQQYAFCRTSSAIRDVDSVCI